MADTIVQLREALDALVQHLPAGWAKNKAKDATITIMLDQELLAFKEPRQPWSVRKTRCVHCGEGCLNVDPNYLSFGVDGEGKCNKLIQDGDLWLCDAGHEKPFCCLGPGCSITCPVEYY